MLIKPELLQNKVNYLNFEYFSILILLIITKISKITLTYKCQLHKYKYIQ